MTAPSLLIRPMIAALALVGLLVVPVDAAAQTAAVLYQRAPTRETAARKTPTAADIPAGRRAD